MSAPILIFLFLSSITDIASAKGQAREICQYHSDCVGDISCSHNAFAMCLNGVCFCDHACNGHHCVDFLHGCEYYEDISFEHHVCHHNCLCPISRCSTQSDCSRYICSHGGPMQCLAGYCHCSDLPTTTAKPTTANSACNSISDCSQMLCPGGESHCIDYRCQCKALQEVNTHTTAGGMTETLTTRTTTPKTTIAPPTSSLGTTLSMSTSTEPLTQSTDIPGTIVDSTPNSTSTYQATTKSTTTQGESTTATKTMNQQSVPTTTETVTTRGTTTDKTTKINTETTTPGVTTTRDPKDPHCNVNSDCTPLNTFVPIPSFHIPCTTENRRYCINGACQCLADPPTTTTPAPTAGITHCHTCGDLNSKVPCDLQTVYLGHLTKCPSGLNYCMTDIYQQDIFNSASIYKRCVDEDTCKRLWLDQTSDIDTCVNYSAAPGQYVCHFCCTENGCNSGVVPNNSSYYFA